MKIFGNIGTFAYLTKTILALKEQKKRIDALKAEGNTKEEIKEIHDVCRLWSDKVVNYLNLTINVINPENLPESGPVVYVSNHQSYTDILMFLNVPKHQIGFIAKEELTKIPVFADWILRIESLFIKRGDARASLATIKKGAQKISDGYSLVIFPEGTRSRSNKMASFKQGSLKLATKVKATVVPVTIRNSFKVFEETGRIQKGQRVDFIVHEPIDTSLLDRKELSELSDRVEEIVRKGLEME